MTEKQPASIGASLDELREHAKWLANDLAGPLRRVSVQSGDVMIEVEWQHADPTGGPPLPQLVPEPADSPSADQAADGHVVISSPMVGTLYRSPSPDAAPFVEVGDTVEPGQTVAIVEAMKLFNPITAELPGVVTEVLAVDGQPVQFGQPLLRLKAASPDAPAGGEE